MTGQFRLPLWISLIRGAARPSCGFGPVLGQAFAGRIKVGEKGFGRSIVLFRRFSQPTCGFCIIPVYALSIEMKRGEILLCVWVPVFGGKAVPSHCFAQGHVNSAP